MNVRVDLNYPINDGTEVVFRSPVDCSQVTGLKVYYPENGATTSKEFAFADAHGNNVGDIPNLFAENVVVKVILDVTTGMAFVQNADTNAYLEGRFAEAVTHTPQTLTEEQKAQARENIGAAEVVLVSIVNYDSETATYYCDKTSKDIFECLKEGKAVYLIDDVGTYEARVYGLMESTENWALFGKISIEDYYIRTWTVYMNGDAYPYGTELVMYEDDGNLYLGSKEPTEEWHAASKAYVDNAVNNAVNTGEWVCIEKICFGYELLPEKPADWDTNKTSYFKVNSNSSKMEAVAAWDSYAANTYWRHTGEVESEVTEIVRTAEPDGTPYNFKGITAFGHIYNAEKAGLWCFCAYLGGNTSANSGIAAVTTLDKVPATYPYHMAYKLTQDFGAYNLLGLHGGQGGFTSVTSVTNARTAALLRPVSDGNITQLNLGIYSAKEYYGEGDYIEIWGVRA
jgi:hypothetical protein